MDSALVIFAAIGFLAQTVMLYGGYVQSKPRLSMVLHGGYAVFWAYLAVVEFFELHFAVIGLVALLVILLPLSAVSFRRRWRANRTQSA